MKLLKPTIFLMIIFVIISCKQEIKEKNMSNIVPPKAKKVARLDTVNGVVLKDDYYWLREKESEEVLDYLKAENKYTDAMTEHLKPLQDALYKEMIARINEDDASVPVKDDEYYYYSRMEKGKNYAINCRKKGDLDAKEEIIMDENILAEGTKYFSVGALEVSSDHKLMAYAIDVNGSEEYDIYIKNLETGEMLSDRIEKTAGSIVWANNNTTFYYTMLDETHRPYQLHRHDLGKNENKLVFEELDGSYFLYPFKEKNERFIYVYLGSKVTTEMYFMDADNPDDNFKVIQSRKQGMEYSVANHGDDFYVLTNDKALNFKLMKTNVDTPSMENWTEVMPHDDKVLLSSVETFENHLVIYGRKGGFKHIHITDLRTNKSHEVEFPEPVYTYWGGENPNFEGNTIRFTYSSMITPRTVYDYDMDSKELTVQKVYEVKGGFDKSDYVVERLEATAADGTKIPISVAYKKGIKRDGTNPCYLYSYGSYGSSTEPYFSTIRVSLLDRGFVYAIAHIRGGSEMGRKWYEDGKFLKKKNTFTDFVNCAEHLVAEKYTSSEKLAIAGGSAGGLLMGAVANMRPDLFNTVVAHVPFVDVMNTMLDETIPLTVVEYEEWGNPNDKTYFDYMLSYSPYDNVEAKAYPNILVTAGLNDPRVQYWEPAKWTAKLRDLKTDDKTLLLKTNMGAGHGGASGRYEALKEYAFEYAFVLDKLK
ncbi:MAG: oligopeptidase B [Cognaticolwellia sp.]|jgi:oligopeptidase B